METLHRGCRCLLAGVIRRRDASRRKPRYLNRSFVALPDTRPRRWVPPTPRSTSVTSQRARARRGREASRGVTRPHVCTNFSTTADRELSSPRFARTFSFLRAKRDLPILLLSSAPLGPPLSSIVSRHCVIAEW